MHGKFYKKYKNISYYNKIQYKIFNSISIMGKRMAFYSGVWKRNKFTISYKKALLYKKYIDKVIEYEHSKFDKKYYSKNNKLPQLLTYNYVKKTIKCIKKHNI